MPSATTEVLSTPKLLLNIFIFSSELDNASCLLVNKTWANEVINVEWRIVDEPKPLIRLFAPLEVNEDDLHVFSRPLVPADWERFCCYAPRVKFFSQELDIFDDSVYEAIAQIQQQAVLLPNLENLTCAMACQSLDVFLHPGVSFLTLYVDDNYEIDFEGLEWSFSVIVKKVASSLADLTFGYELEDDLLEASEDLLVSTLRELKTLSILSMPPHWLSDRVARELARLPALVDLDTWMLDDYLDRTEIIPAFSSSLNWRSFPFLNKLSLSIPFKQAIPGFASWGRSLNLRSLIIVSHWFETPERYKAIIKVIVEAFPYLGKLTIRADSELPENTPPSPLTFKALESIIHLKRLESLDLHYTTALHLDADELSVIFYELRFITTLLLNPVPSIQTTPSLHLTCLSGMRNAHSQVKSLGLYVDTPLDGFGGIEMASPPFEHLQSLNLGYSPLSQEAAASVAAYLGQALPEGCQLEARPPNTIMSNERLSSPDWKRVWSIVPLFRQAMHAGDIGEASRLRVVYPTQTLIPAEHI
ncbi:hypothetical protein ONZ45_g7771 [Pleurotus djamor]|nr:hypothetical protein ONZ45_g7771 [Pleurotus djamor]